MLNKMRSNYENTFEVGGKMRLIEKLKEENKNLKKQVERYRGRPFISGVVGKVDEDGMYEYVLVTPMHGSDGFFVYKKTGEYVSSEY